VDVVATGVVFVRYTENVAKAFIVRLKNVAAYILLLSEFIIYVI